MNCGDCIRFKNYDTGSQIWLGHCSFKGKNVSMPDPGCEGYVDEEILDVYERLFINRRDTYAVQQRDGSYRRVEGWLTKPVLKRHLAGEITVGAYQINPRNNSVLWLCSDVDPEHVEKPKEATINIYRECASRFYEKATLIESSRWPDPSFHLWCFFWPVPFLAKAARWLGKKILEHSGVVVELFPKQDEVNPSDFGNQMKLPLGFHREKRKWSLFLNPENLEPLQSTCLKDVEGCSFSEKDTKIILQNAEKEASNIQSKLAPSSRSYKGKRKVRPCFFETLLNRVDIPHKMRLAIAIEYLAAGYTVDQITVLFEGQEDFDEEKTRYQINHAKERAYQPRKCSTIQELGFCIGNTCSIFHRRRRQFEKKVDAL